MEVRTTRFGVVEIAEDRVITFPKGLLGFGQMKRYCLLEPGNDACFFWLQSLDDPTLAFVVTDPSFSKPPMTVGFEAASLWAKATGLPASTAMANCNLSLMMVLM